MLAASLWQLPAQSAYALAVCGDAIVAAPEQCDDGNADDGDGCETDCTLSIGCKVYTSTDVPKAIPALLNFKWVGGHEG
jgi:cysteine-rich repeat protein